jgi:hypothetical protein
MAELDRWWGGMPAKRTDTYRHLPLEHAGACASVNDCVIARAHDRTLPLKLKMFSKENVSKSSFSNGNNNNNDVASGWERPRSVLEVQCALANLAEVMAALWPQDPTARVLNRVLLAYEFGRAYDGGERDKCRLLEDFCDTVLRENARRAVTGGPPLSFQQSKERWRDLVELRRPSQTARKAEGSGSMNRSGGDRRVNRGAGSNGGGVQGAAKSTVFTRSTTVRFNGDLICYHFNNAGKGCGRQLKGSGCDNGKGGVYAHVCNHEFSSGLYCFAKHARCANH